MNFLLVENLQRLYTFYGDNIKVEFPTRSGNLVNLSEAADLLMMRLIKLFLPDENGRRPCHGNDKIFATQKGWKKLILYYEYFDGDTGRGLGASHQTGWTSLVACLIKEIGLMRERQKKT